MSTQIDPTSTRKNVERVQGLLEAMKQDAQAAAQAQDAYMLSVYEELLSVASPIVMKAIHRLEREELASIRRSLKEAKKATDTQP